MGAPVRFEIRSMFNLNACSTKNAGPLPVFIRRIPLLNPFNPSLTSIDDEVPVS
ncbi:hypothetical protein [Pseudomonas sp. NPDC089401]|uniref:hypothetical protein n=1 Tax=Pseudomonas sp. NPDC089401 TaxID=3364462 RepID=UPI003830FC13